jgi:ANTAR domain-containing protein
LFTNEDSLGALNLYSPQLRGFDAKTRGEGLAFATQAAVALRSARDKEDLRIAMATRNLIGQAQGILMERYKMTAEQAFAVLTRASQDTNVKRRDVAQHLIDTGRPPPVAAAAAPGGPAAHCLDHRAWGGRVAGPHTAATVSGAPGIGLSRRDARERLLVAPGAPAADRHRIAPPVSTVGFVQPDVDVVDYLIEAVEVHLLHPRGLVVPAGRDVPAEGVKFIAEAADQLLGNASCAEV